MLRFQPTFDIGCRMRWRLPISPNYDRCWFELGELGSEHGQLARQLQERLDDVDMEGMQTLLDQLSDA